MNLYKKINKMLGNERPEEELYKVLEYCKRFWNNKVI